MAATVVLGGGLTGLVAAERLSAAGLPAIVLERELEPGGACRTIERDGFHFDFTGHLLHIAQPETEGYLRELEVWDGLELHQRRAAVVVGGRQTPYPIQIHTAALAPEVRRDCLLGFIRAWASQEREGAEPPDFATWVRARFGEGLARHFFVPYNEKLYRAPAEELSLDWVGRYVPRPTLEEVVDGALGLHDRPVGYNATFRYPRRGGIRVLPDAVARRVPGLELGSRAVALHLGERWLETADGRRLAFGRLVSTVALPGLVDLLVGGLPDEVAAARAALRWVRVLGVVLGVEGEAPSPQHWLYFPDRELPFYRVGFPSNHGRLAPEGCHTVSIELSLDPGGAQVAEEAAAAEAALAAIGLLDPRRVRVRVPTVIDPAYVVFDHRRRPALAALRRFFDGHGVLLAGRWAEWKYSAMEDAILDGMAVARKISEK